MKDNLFTKHLKFSIRKLSVGVASLAIGAFLVGTVNSQSVLAETASSSTVDHSPLTQYNYVSETELSESEKALIQAGLPTPHGVHCHNYYLVYRPNQAGLLPKTASEALSALTVAGEVLFVVLGISLVATSKGKKERLVSSIMLVTLSGTIFVPTIQALHTNQLASYNQVYTVQSGDKMPEVAEIPGYKYIGFISLCGCQTKTKGSLSDLSCPPQSVDQTSGLAKLPVSTSPASTEPSSDKVVSSSKPVVSESSSSSVTTSSEEVSPSSKPVVPESSSLSSATASSEEVKPSSKPVVSESSSSSSATTSSEAVKPSSKPVIPEVTPSSSSSSLESSAPVPSSSTVVVKPTVPVSPPAPVASSSVIKETEVVQPPASSIKVETSETTIVVPSSTQVIKEVETVVTVPSATTITTTEEVIKETTVPVPEVQTSETVISSTKEDGQVETVVSQVETVVTVPSATTITTTEEVVKETTVETEVVKTSQTVVETATEVKQTVPVVVETQTESSTAPQEPVSPPSSSTLTPEPVPVPTEPSSEVSQSSSVNPSSSSSQTEEISVPEGSSISSESELEVSSSSKVSEVVSSSSVSESSDASSSSESSSDVSSSSEESSQSEVSSSSASESTPSSSQVEEPVVDKTALATLVAEDEPLRGSLRYIYAEASVKQAYEDSLAQAREILLATPVTQEQVDASLLSLKEAMERLNGRLKSEPTLSLNNVETDDDSVSAQLAFRLADSDQAASKLVVKIYDGEKLVNEVTVTDFSNPVGLTNLEYGIVYTIKTDLVYDLRTGEQTKTNAYEQTIEFKLKQEPALDLIDVTKDNDARTATLTFTLTDPDSTVQSGTVKVYNGDTLVKEVSVSDFSQPLTIDGLDYTIPYSFKTDLTYDLRDGAQTKPVEHEQTVELDLKSEPALVLTQVDKDNDARTATLTFTLTDPDSTVQSGTVKVYNGDTLVKEVSVSDFSQPLMIDGLDYTIPYSFKTDLTYDLRDGVQTKPVEHEQTVELDLKSEPALVLTQVDKDNDARTATLTFILTDPDSTVQSGKVKVYDGDTLVKEVSVSDFSQPLTIDGLDYTIPYSFKTDLTYDLRDGAQTKPVEHEQTVELDLKSEPALVLTQVDKDNDARTATLTFTLTDPDSTVQSGTVKVYNGDTLVKEVSVSDFSQPLTIDGLDYTIPYSFKTDLTYDLRNGAQTKPVEHEQVVTLDLKQVPTLTLTQVDKDELGKSIRLTYDLTDPDRAYLGAIAKIYDGETLVKEVTITDLSQATVVDGLDYNLPYTIKTELLYDIRQGQESKTTTAPDPVELKLKKVVFKDVYKVTLYRYENGQLVEQNSLPAASDVSSYVVKLESDRYKDVLLPVESVNGDKVRVVWPQMVQDVDGSYQEGFEFSLGQNEANTTSYSRLAGYDNKRQTAYNNMEKLLPFYNKETILDYGNKVSPTSKLYQTEVVSVVPMVDNDFVTDYYGKHEQINRLMIHYLDNTVEYIDLTNGQFFEDSQIKEYSLAGTDLIYTPEQFIQNQDALLDELTREFEQLDYFDSIVKLYPNFKYDYTLQIAERHSLGAGKTNEQANQSLKDKKVDPLYLQPTYEKVKENIRSYLQSLLSQEIVSANQEGRSVNSDYLKDKYLSNKEKLLLSLAYVDRLYNINYDDKNIKELSLFRQDFFGQKVNPTDILIKLGGSDINNLKFSNSASTYQTYLGSQNGQTTVMDYLSAYNKLLTNKSDNEWFKSASKAYIVETPSKEVPEANTEIYKALSIRKESQSYYLPLLTLSDEGLFVISNMTTLNYGMYDRVMDMSLKDKNPVAYEAKVAEVKESIDKAAESQREHFDLWYRIASDSVKDRLFKHRDIPIENWDGYLYDNRRTWMHPYGGNASSRMTDFFAPLGKWYVPNGTGAFATGRSTHFVIDTMLSDYGHALTTHEMTHNLDAKVYLGGYERRTGMRPDAFTTGLFESAPNAQNKRIGLNLHADYVNDYDGRFATQRNYNASPDRFQSMSDVDQYVKGMFDVIYTLDAIEGEVYLDSPLAKKKELFRRMEMVNGVDVAARNSAFTTDEWNNLSFNSLADLVNNQVVIATADEYARNREYKRDGYDLSLLFVPMYGALTYDRLAPDNLTFKRLSYELWAELGYDGMLNYTSDKLRRKALDEGQVYDDRYILKETFGNQYTDFAAFKLDMLERRLDKAKAGNLKSVTFTYKGKTYQASYQQIKDLMTQMVANNPKEVAALKEAIYRAYLLDTDDFRQSIYQ